MGIWIGMDNDLDRYLDGDVQRDLDRDVCIRVWIGICMRDLEKDLNRYISG